VAVQSGYASGELQEMERLVTKIKEQFSREAVIEIYVLDESGSPMELYSGLPHALTTNCLDLVLHN
jgi:RNase H-fold protein (predicted Holliday junction resolvase)